MPILPKLKHDDKLIFLSDDDLPTLPSKSRRFGVGYSHTPGRKTEFVNDVQRPVMEDMLLIKGAFKDRENEDLYCIFDGHDGSTAAKFATGRFEHLFVEQLSRIEELPRETIDRLLVGIDFHQHNNQQHPEDRQKRIGVALHTTFERLNSELRGVLMKTSQTTLTNSSDSSPEFLGGTTALIAYFDDQDLYIANVGDTRAILGKEAGPERISVDHHPMVCGERERIEACGGRIHNASCPRIEGLAISRTLGDFDLEDKGVVWHPYIRVIRNFRESGQFLVMASDGLWELVSEEEVVKTVQEELDFSLVSSPVLFRKRPPLFKKPSTTPTTSPPSSLSSSIETLSSSPPSSLSSSPPTLSSTPTSSPSLSSSSTPSRRRKLDLKGDSESASEASTRLVRRAFEHYFSVDNISVIVVRFS